MIISKLYTTNKDNKNLLYTIDALTDSSGDILTAPNGSPIPSGNYILQDDTGVSYDIAFDLEGVTHSYSSTDIMMDDVNLKKIYKILEIEIVENWYYN